MKDTGQSKHPSPGARYSRHGPQLLTPSSAHLLRLAARWVLRSAQDVPLPGHCPQDLTKEASAAAPWTPSGLGSDTTSGSIVP